MPEPVEAPEVDELQTESVEAPETATQDEQVGSDDFGSPEGFNISEVPEEYREQVANIEKQFKGHYTQKTQELAEQRKTYEANQELIDWFDQFQNEDPVQTQAALYRWLQESLDNSGYWNEEDEEDEVEPEAEFHDPRFSVFLEQSKQHQQEQEQEQAQYERLVNIAEQIEKVDKTKGLNLTESELTIIAEYAMQNDGEDGTPDTGTAVNRVKQMRREVLNQYIESKKAPQLQSGVPGSESLNLNDDDVRRKHMLDLVEAKHTQENS